MVADCTNGYGAAHSVCPEVTGAARNSLCDSRRSSVAPRRPSPVRGGAALQRLPTSPEATHEPLDHRCRAAQCASVNSLTFVQRRVVDKAAEGIRPLVQYIHRTRAIHPLDVMETIAWLDERREMRQACGERVGRLSPNGQ
jgi:hypothetical protein